MRSVMSSWRRLAPIATFVVVLTACGMMPAACGRSQPEPAGGSPGRQAPTTQPPVQAGGDAGSAPEPEPAGLFGDPVVFGPGPDHGSEPRRMITSAEPVILDDLQIVHGWSRPLGTGEAGAAYLTIRNMGQSTYTLTAVQGAIARTTELRSVQAITDSVDVTGGATVMLEPGGVHAALLNVRKTLSPGQVYTLTLVFVHGASGASVVSVDVPIEIVPAEVADTVATQTP